MLNRLNPSSRRALLVAAALIPIVAACGNPASAPAAATSSPSIAASQAGPKSTGHLGDTLTYRDIAGTAFDVTLVKVVDPASVSSTNAASVGSRWVGLVMTIDDHGGPPDADSQAADGTGSDGQRYGFNTSYHIGTFSECSPTVASVGAGQTGTFCAGFMVPTGVTVVSVGYSVAGADVGSPDNLTWSVP